MDFLTCLSGHRNPREKWSASSVDPACLLCPVCSEVADEDKPPRRGSDSAREVVPIGRHPAHVASLVVKLRAWVENRERHRLDCKDLKRAIEYLEEYAALMRAIDPEVAESRPERKPPPDPTLTPGRGRM